MADGRRTTDEGLELRLARIETRLQELLGAVRELVKGQQRGGGRT